MTVFDTAAAIVPAQRSPNAARIIGQKLKPRRRMAEHEASFLARHASSPFKMTLPAPSYILARGYRPT